MKNKKLKVDFMIYDITKDEWTWISEIKSGEFIHNNTLVKVFTSQTGHVFFKLNGEIQQFKVLHGKIAKKLLKIDKIMLSIMLLWNI